MARETYEKYHNYLKGLSNANTNIKAQEQTFIILTNLLKESEEKRILLCKGLLSNYFKCMEDIALLCKSKSQLFLNSLIQIKYQVSAVPTEESPFQVLERDQYIFTVQSADASTSESMPGNFMNDDKYFKIGSQTTMKETLNAILAGTAFGIEDKSNILSWLNTPEFRSHFALLLKDIAAESPVLSKEGYQSIKELCNYLLTEWITWKDEREDTLDNILIASRGIIGQLDNNREFLYIQIIRHGVWQEIDIWKNLIDRKISARIKQYEGTKKTQGLLDKLKNMMTTGISMFLPLDDPSGPESLECKAALNVLMKFCYFLSNPSLNVDKAIKLYKDYGKKFDIPKSKLCDLELELMKCQKAPILKMSKRKAIVTRIEKKSVKYGKYYVLSMAIKYINEKTTLRNILVLSIHAKEKLRLKVFRQILMNPNVKLTIKERLSIWKQLMNMVISYLMYRQQQEIIRNYWKNPTHA